MAKLQIKTTEKLEVCVCPKCKWIYVSDTPFACENNECSSYGKKGKMYDVIPKKKN